MGDVLNWRAARRQGLQLRPPTLQGYLSYIKSLPLNDMPEIFGLHDNANITFAQNETYALLGAIIRLQPKSSSVGGQGREEVGGSTGKGPKSWAGPISHPPSCLLPCGKELCSCEILQGLEGVGAALTPSIPLPLQIVQDVAQNILLQVPEPINLQLVITKYPVLYEESMNTVLVQEVIR